MPDILDFLGRIDPLNMFLAVLVVGSIYTSVDGLGRLGLLPGEYGRKAIHITVGMWAATFPLFLSRFEIFVFHGMFFVGIVALSLISDFTKHHRKAREFLIGRFLASIFQRYEDVGRWTIGQFLYPLSLVLVVLFYDDLAIYSFAVLTMALADGFAAVIGKPFGRIIYHVPGGQKSLLGSITFFCLSFTLLVIFALVHSEVTAVTPGLVMVYAIVLTIAEGVTAGGFDNVTVPLLAAVFLNTL